MSFPFHSDFRDSLAARCADFPRVVHEDPALKRAAVAVTLLPSEDGSGETAFLLTRRAPKMRAHAGQWALPGGRCDPGETVEETALRELEEEVGVRLSPDNILGVLDDYPTRSGYTMTPVLTWLDDPGELKPNPQEVASIHRIALSEIQSDEKVAFLTIPESPRPVIRLYFGEQFVHAPTAAVLYQMRELALGRVTRVADLEQPVFAWR